MVTSGDSPTEPRTWHHGVVAKWWAEFNTSGPEIVYLEKFTDEAPTRDTGMVVFSARKSPGTVSR